MEVKIETKVVFKGFEFGVVLTPSKDSGLLKASIRGVKGTLFVSWRPDLYANKAYIQKIVYPKGTQQRWHHLSEKEQEKTQDYAVGILRLVAFEAVSRNHGGASHDKVDEPWVSQLIRSGHFRRPTERHVGGGVIIVAATVVNPEKLTPEERAVLWEKARMLTLASKAVGKVVSYEEAVKITATMDKKEVK